MLIKTVNYQALDLTTAHWTANTSSRTPESKRCATVYFVTVTITVRDCIWTRDLLLYPRHYQEARELERFWGLGIGHVPRPEGLE